jgi:hypothetical protein
MNALIVGILSGSGGVVLAAVVTAIYHAARKRIRPSPEAETLAKMVPAVNAMLAVQEPTLTVVIAIGEKVLGADDEDVKIAKTARSSFKEFMGKAICIEAQA